MPRSSIDKTREFQEKMRTQGAAGFAAGPWREVEASLGMDQSVVVDQNGNPVWSVKHTHRPRNRMSRSTFDRLTGGIATLALATLVTSVLAIYFEQHVDSGDYLLAGSDASVEPDSDRAIHLPRPSTRGFIERPAIEVVAVPPAPVEQALMQGNTESTAMTGTAPEQAPAVADGQAFQPALANATGIPGPMTSDRLNTATSADADIMTASPPERSQEQTGTAAAEAPAEPDNPALAGLAAFGSDAAGAINSMTRQQSPAAIAIPAPATDRPPMTDPSPANRPHTGIGRTATAEPETGPATEAATAAAVNMETPEVKAARETAPGPEAPVVAADALEAESGSADPGPDDPDRTRLALASPPAVAPPAETATSEAAQAASPALDDVPVPGDTGRWIINLASYAGPRTADRMQRKFENLGVSTDRQVAEVNGKTMYRLRIAAFRSYGDAEAYFNSIKDRLGLDSAWITKQ